MEATLHAFENRLQPGECLTDLVQQLTHGVSYQVVECPPVPLRESSQPARQGPGGPQFQSPSSGGCR